ncbi:mamu class II histocompatibility antigen, DR alpha chain-like [Trichomycterus rosablanca]|uniref:mamu class II histocompatibility antigen, DR alpha chain-like n=1 Tax=Trichomycterus rosablanca TaxID=2290929 RepID=UPI002F353570
MKFYMILFTLVCVRAQIKHEHMLISACSDTEKEFMYGIDGEENYYADFVKQKVVNMQPPFADLGELQDMYEQAVGAMELCKQNLQMVKSLYKDRPVPQDVPQNSIYSRDDVQVGSKSILICHSARFFPPSIHIYWTKNGENVTDGAELSQFYPNEDGTYNVFSHLSFTPEEGDVYTCTVQHKALQMPDTKTWEVDVDVKIPSIGPSVFCGVGLALGLLGVATGTFFLVKGNQCN